MLREDYTIEKAIKISEESLDYSIVITNSVGTILHCNNSWTNMCGYTKNDVIGKTNVILQGALTEPYIIREINNGVVNKYPVTEVIVTNYKKSGISFKNHLTILRLRDGFASIVRDLGSCDYTVSYEEKIKALNDSIIIQD